ncbi:hypothetical protein [Phocaeicola barnesiae]|uniref:hypothetical protein n=1 Tax=Phocaeicola barnesiae TaxID=376804 RepID=UPI0025A42A12|nr:hypothetical protein [Phocaeicola barnesiae]MDM8251184.1 hypothetical protein [Phocaeicola barnesiae]MDM8253410.1 hypothetical protein [Phocaeicola barnesiae]
MKRWFLYIGACLLAFVCFACTDEMEADGNSKERSVKLQLQLSLPMDASARTTRMTSGFEAGSKYENYINLNSYRIYFFDTNNNYIARFIPSKTVMAEATEYTLYSVEGEVPEDVLRRASSNTMDFKIVVLANWEKYEEPEAGRALGTICNADWAQFERLKSFELGEDNLIPFYGVNEYEDVPVQYGGTITLEESIPLLRAMAKVEVVLNTEEMSFSHVTLHGYNSKGYCAPMNGAYPQNGHIGLHLVENKNEDNAIENTISFLQTQSDNKTQSDNEKETWIAYVPEYDNSDEDNAAYIELRFDIQTETDEKDFVIHFADDQTDIENTSFDITRNHLYRFNVTIDPKGNLAVEVNDWKEEYENEFNF